jgi:hypothetical protein
MRLGLAMLALLFAHAASAQEPHITRDRAPGIQEEAGADTSARSEGELEAQYLARLALLREQNATEPLQLDAYGGWVNAPASLGAPEPGAYFRVAKRGGAWWFITPEGHPFVSKAVTDVNWLGATLSADGFHELLVQKYGDEEAWVAAAQQRMLDWGFNTIGPWSSASMEQKMAHSTIILDMGGGNGPRYPKSVVTDYWSPEFAAHAVAMVRERATPHVEDKNLLGYFLDNEIVWGADHFLTKWTLPQLYVSFPEGAPGRVELLRFLRESAGTIEQFNAIWQTEIGDWAELESLSARHLRPQTAAAEAVTEEFKIAVFRKYATIAIEALRAVDPNHLILGCRFHTYPGDTLVRLAAEYFDVISMAFYEARPPVAEIDAIYGEVDKPFLIEEWTFKSDDSGIANPMGIYAPEVKNQKERCLAYDNYVESFMRRPYGIGYHWYKWMDNPVLPEEKFSGDNCGLLNQNDEPYEPFVSYVGEVNRRVEQWHHAGQASARAAAQVDHFADNGFSNPVSTLQHPSAEHHEGVTYIAYQGPLEDPYVCAYDHERKEWTGPVKAGSSLMGKQLGESAEVGADDHGRPALLVDGEGYIHLVFGGHGGYPKFGKNELGAWGKGRQTHVVSTRPRDISSWEELDNISPFGTYSQFVKMDDGDIYLFYRHGSHQSDWVYQKSTDHCRTFAPPVSVLKHETAQEDTNLHHAWYAWFGKGRGDSIAVSFVYHPCRTQQHTKERYNGYYMLLDCEDDTWQNVRGEAVAIPLTKERADAHTQVYDSGSKRSKRGTCHVDEDGAPHITFEVGKALHYYRWLGDDWQAPSTVVSDAGESDFVVDSPLSARVLVAQDSEGVGEIAWWKTEDGGVSWTKGETLFSLPGTSFRMGALVQDGSPEAIVVASGSKGDGGGLLRDMYLVGRDGAIPRATASVEAEPLPELVADEEGVVKLETQIGVTGTLSFTVRTDQAYHTGPGVKPVSIELIEIPKVASVRYTQTSMIGELNWIWAPGIRAEKFDVEIPGLAGPAAYFVQYTWDAPGGRMMGYVNGTPLALSAETEPWDMQASNELRLPEGPFEVEVLAVDAAYLEEAEARDRVPANLLGKHSELFGAALEGVDPIGGADRQGALLYETSFEGEKSVENWVMEGPGETTFQDGWMTMASERPDSPLNDGHTVYWCPADFPASFVAEWEVEILSERGLCIVFFAAEGEDGKDLFDPSLPERDGDFGQYTRGAVDCYHISYFASTPSKPWRISSNLRKNSGFHLVANGPPGIRPGSGQPHTVRLVKDGAHIQMQVDREVIIDFTDDPERYGPVLGAGKIGLRQMQWTAARYNSFRVWNLEPALGESEN